MNRFFGGGTMQQGNVGSPVNNSMGSYMRPVNSYYPTGVSNFYPQSSTPVQTGWPQQTMQQNLQPQQAMIPNQTNIIWVESIDDINRYPTGKGWQQWFGDKNNPILYVRETDANGVIQPIAKLRYEDYVETPQVNHNTDAAPVSAPVYDGPTKKEFDELRDSVNSLIEKLGDLVK